MKRILAKILIILPFLLVEVGFGQEVRAYLNKQQLTTDDVLIYNLEVSGAGGRLRTPNFPKIKGFNLGAISTSTRFGPFGSSVTFSRTYYPSVLGKHTVPPFRVQLGKKQVTTPQFVVNVTKGTGKKKQSNQRRHTFDPFDFFQSPADQFFGNKKQKRKELVYEDVNADYFLAVHLNKSECFIGEQLLGEVVLYINERDRRKIGVDGRDIGEMQQRIKNDAFWEEIIELDEIKPERVKLKGKNYYAYTLYRTILFPIQDGTLEIKNVWMNAKKLAVATNASPFAQLFGQNTKYNPIKIYAGNKKIKVKPLPNTNLKNAHSVGKFNMTAELNEKKVNTGDPVEVKVTIKGNGNPALIRNPVFKPDAVFKQYEPTSSYSITKNSRSLWGQKEFTFMLVPQRKGEYELGPVRFYYFDPSKKKFDSLEVKSLSLSVEGEDVENLVLSGTNLDAFYESHFKEADHSVPFQIPYQGALLIFISVSLLGVVAYKQLKS